MGSEEARNHPIWGDHPLPSEEVVSLVAVVEGPLPVITAWPGYPHCCPINERDTVSQREAPVVNCVCEFAETGGILKHSLIKLHTREPLLVEEAHAAVEYVR